MQNEKVHDCSVIGFLKRESLHFTCPFQRMNLERFLSRYCSDAQEGNVKECWRKLSPQVPPLKGGRDANSSLMMFLSDCFPGILVTDGQEHSNPKTSWCSNSLASRGSDPAPVLHFLCLRRGQETAPNPHILQKMFWKIFKQREI